MKIHRFIVGFELTGTAFRLTEPALVHQIKNVLKLKVGEQVSFCDGNLNEAIARLSDFGSRDVGFEIMRWKVNENEPNLKGILYCSVLKKENFETVVQKATEVGVDQIVPVVTRRTVKLGLNVDRLTDIAREAAEQSLRGVVPVISPPIPFQDAVEHAVHNDVNFLFEGDAPLFDRGVLRLRGMNRAGIFIGTEGGWDPVELEQAKNKFFHVVSLGPLTFRAETAAIIASYLVLAPLI